MQEKIVNLWTKKYVMLQEKFGKFKTKKSQFYEN